MAAAVVRRCGHSSRVASRRGVLLSVEQRLGLVQWDGESRPSLVPLANLAKISPTFGVIDPSD